MPAPSPLVSILTPSFNQAKWLTDNLSSVARQTYSNIEHIVMDGGSSDHSLDLLHQADAKHLKWRSEPDRGQSHALNKAFEVSNGEIIGWLNSDDAYLDVKAIERAVQCFQENPDIGLVYGHSLLVNASNEVLQILWAPPSISPFNHFITPFYQPSVFIRRSVLGDTLVDESLHYVMDADLWNRLYPRTRFARIDCVVGLERHQPSRKVLSADYLEERRRYSKDHGENFEYRFVRAFRRCFTIGSRIRGVGPFLRAEQLVDSAVPLRYPPRAERIKLQLLTPRAQMHATSSEQLQ